MMFKLMEKAPLGLMLAMSASVASVAAFAAAPSDAHNVPPPPVADPMVAWVLQLAMGLVVAAVVPPLGWLSLRMMLLATSATSAAVRAAAAFIAAHVRRTPSVADDGPGLRMSAELVRIADELDADAERKRGKE